MNRIALLVFCFMTLIACHSQEKTDLEKLNFSKNYKEVFKDEKFQTEPREITSTLPIAYTKNVGNFKFGTINFENSADSEIKKSSIGLLINNTTERVTKGIKIEIENTSIGNTLLNYLKSNYGSPKVLSGIPKKNREGQILGNSAFYWDLKGKKMILSQYYEYTNGRPNVSSILFLIDDKVLCQGIEESAAAHIIKTYTP